MFSPLPRYERKLRLRAVVIALAIASLSGTSAFAQGGFGLFGGRFNRGYYPYYGYGGGYPGYNVYGNFGVYGYPGSGIEGGASNSGYDPGYGGYPSYGGYGITNRYPSAAYRVNGAGNYSPYAPYGTQTAAAAAPAQSQRRLLGIDEEPVVMPGGSKAMKVGRVFPGSAAERAGLQTGDVIRSINGYLTEQRGNLAWIIANAMPNNELKINIQTVKDGRDHLITATLP